MKVLRSIAIGLVVLLVSIAGVIAWVLNSQSGARSALGFATRMLEGRLAIGQVHGTLVGPVTLVNLRYRDPETGLDVFVQRVRLNVVLADLLHRHAHVSQAAAQGVRVALPTQEKPKEETPPFNPPLDIRIDQLTVDDTRITRAGKPLVAISHIGAVGGWRSDPQQGRADLRVSWKGVAVPAEVSGQALHSAGQLHATGNPEAFAAQGTLSLGPPKQLAAIALDVRGTPELVDIQRLDVNREDGRLHATGRVQFKPHLSWRLHAQGKDFDPSTLLAQWPGQLNFEIRTQGTLAKVGPEEALRPSGTLQLLRLDGRLRDRPVSGKADLELTQEALLSGSLMLRSGDSVVQVEGERGETMDATATFKVATLDDWVPQASGALRGKVRAQGVWPQLRMAGSATGVQLKMNEARVRAVDLKFDIKNPKDPQGSITLVAREGEASGVTFKTLNLEAEGSQREHTAHLKLDGEPMGGEIQVAGSRRENGWSGTLQNLLIAVPNVTRLNLQEPARVAWLDGVLNISESCLVDGEMRLCVGAEAKADRTFVAHYSLRNIPLAMAQGFASKEVPVDIDGIIGGDGEVRRDAQGAFLGNAVIFSDSGSIAQADEETELLLSYRDLRITADVKGDVARIDLGAEFIAGNVGDGEQQRAGNATGSLSGQINITQLMSGTPVVNGRASADIPSVAPIALFAPQLANVTGRAETRASFSGTFADLGIAGEVRALDIGMQVPRLGIQLRDGTVSAALRPGGTIELEGGLTSGEGRVTLDGSTTPEGVLTVRIQGNNFLIANLPAARVIAAPDLTFARNPKRMGLEGTVRIPLAEINLQKLPRGTRVQSASSDVVVIDDAVAEKEAAETPLFAAVTVVLGEKVHLTGYGLDANVDGKLLVREAPGASPTGSGQIEINGRYKAYGQDLTVKDGRVLYAGTPLDDPALNMVATREVEEVTVGLRIQGTARRPQVTVFSDPVMSEAHALAYLVTGKPLDQVGQGEGDVLQSAARSVGTAAGGLLAKNVGRRLGIDEIGIKESEDVGGSVFSVGQYLSPNLFLSYGVGLFEPGDVVTLRYEISDKLALQAIRGPENTRAGVEYRLEK